MPRTTDRPSELADAAVTVLASAGIHRLTHRAVDTQAGAPAGTTSNHFRSRASLVTAAARRLLHEHTVEQDRSLTGVRSKGRGRGRRADRAALVAALGVLVDGRDPAARRRYLAYYELVLEAVREPELAEIVARIRATSLRHTADLLGAAGVELSAQRVEWLGSTLTGLALDRIALGVPDGPIEPLIERALTTVLDAAE